MPRLILTFVISLFSICLSQTSDQGKAPFLENAKHFKMNGVELGSSLTAFIAKYPNAESITDSEDTQLGESFYTLDLGDDNEYSYSFLDGKLFMINAIYSPTSLYNMGGVGTLVNKLTAKFGKINGMRDASSYSTNDATAGKGMYWNFIDIGIFIEFLDLKRNDDIKTGEMLKIYFPKQIEGTSNNSI